MSSKPPTGSSPGQGRRTEDDTSNSADVCDIRIDLDLQGVRPGGLQGLSSGDQLELRLEAAGDYESVVCVRADGVTVGAIGNFPMHTKLLSCLRQGVPYMVEVTEVRPGGCHVIGGRADT